MNKNQKTKEKTCAFYASDYHFEMISLPYINKKLDESKEIIVLTENNLKETIKNIGRFSVDIKFGEGINAKLTVDIQPE